MQNDLISRSALIKHLTDWRLQEAPYGICDEETETYKTICECIKAVKEQPTAYDVEKVEKQIHNFKCKKCRNILGTISSDDYCESVKCEVFEICKMVRNGGKE